MSYYEANRFHYLVLFTWQFSIFFATQQIFPIFSSYVPEWKCGDEPFGKNCTLFDQCGGIQNVTFKEVPFYSAAIEFDWICGSRSYLRQLFSQLQFFGVLCGTVSFGTLSDTVGRKPVSLLVLFAGITLNFISGFISDWRFLLTIRFLLGFFMGGVLVAVCTFCMELLLPKQRIMLRGFFNWGIARIILTLICYVFPNWRTASYVTAITAAPAFFIVLFAFPESPTWLHNKGRMGALKRSEEKIARIGGEEYVPKVHKPVEKVTTLCELLSSTHTIRNLSVLWVMWFTASICGYANDLHSNNLSGDFYFNQLLFGVLIYISKLIMSGADRWYPQFSRRLLHQGAQTAVCICFMIMAVFSYLKYKSFLLSLLNIIGTVFIEYTWDACYLCAIENNETNCRASAVGTCSLMARLGAICAPMLNHLATIWDPAVYVVVVGLGTINLAVSYMFLKETKNINLDTVDTEGVNEELLQKTEHINK